MFSREGLVARLHLAAIDHSTSVEREQATTKDGRLRVKVQYSKGVKDYVAKPVRVAKSHDYRQELLTGVLDRCEKSAPLRQQLQQVMQSTKEATTREHYGIVKPDKKLW